MILNHLLREQMSYTSMPAGIFLMKLMGPWMQMGTEILGWLDIFSLLPVDAALRIYGFGFLNMVVLAVGVRLTTRIED